MDRRIKGYESQLTNLKDRITEYEARLTTRREALMTKFMAMEEALSQLKSESTYLDNQLASMNANWSFNNN